MNGAVLEVFEYLKKTNEWYRAWLQEFQFQETTFDIDAYVEGKKYRFWMEVGENEFFLAIWSTTERYYEQRISKEEYETLKQAFYGESKTKNPL